MADPKPLPSDPPWLVEAYKYIGEKEVPGDGVNPTIKMFWDVLGVKFVQDDGGDRTAWCSIFCCAMCQVTGYQSPKRQGSRYWRVDWSGTSFRGAEKLPGFKRGAIVPFWMDAPDKTSGHSGIALELSADGKYVYILDGNSGNGVRYMTKMTVKQVWGYYWPLPLKGAEKPKDKTKDRKKEKNKEKSWLDWIKSWF